MLCILVNFPFSNRKTVKFIQFFSILQNLIFLETNSIDYNKIDRGSQLKFYYTSILVIKLSHLKKQYEKLPHNHYHRNSTLFRFQQIINKIYNNKIFECIPSNQFESTIKTFHRLMFNVHKYHKMLHSVNPIGIIRMNVINNKENVGNGENIGREKNHIPDINVAQYVLMFKANLLHWEIGY